MAPPPKPEQVEKSHENGDSSASTSLDLTLRALTDLSRLGEYTNLEKLDLGCNNLRSLQGIGSCVNLKWLSVAQNKLESLSGIEGLLKLKVLNASKNAIKTMDSVKGLTCLGALILNDNNISSICKLDNLTYLNTLVLSRNPIYDIGKSLENTKSITKLSLSSCKIQDIGKSLVFCMKLKEARFTNNEIATIPDELAKNSLLRLLDLGQNAISKVSDLKVLSTLHSLRNLNLQGNPVAENYDKIKLEKKVKKLVPSLQVFNAKPIGKPHEGKDKNEMGTSSSGMDGGYAKQTKTSSNERDIKGNKKVKEDGGTRRSSKDFKGDASYVSDDPHVGPINDITTKQQKTNEKTKDLMLSSATNTSISPFDAVDREARKEAKQWKTKKPAGNKLREFDDGRSSFIDIILNDVDTEDNPKKRAASKSANEEYLLGGLIINPIVNKKKRRNQETNKDNRVTKLLASPPEIGMGGPSTWDD